MDGVRREEGMTGASVRGEKCRVRGIAGTGDQAGIGPHTIRMPLVFLFYCWARSVQEAKRLQREPESSSALGQRFSGTLERV